MKGEISWHFLEKESESAIIIIIIKIIIIFVTFILNKKLKQYRT
jgi:hypothetical protein